MISTFVAFFDSNVFFSNRLTSLLLWLALSGLFRARWTDEIHEEWIQAAHEKFGIPISDLQRRRDDMDAAVLDAKVTGYADLIDGLTLPDRKDRHVLAAAIRCGASAIVTFNERDFPPDALEQYGIHTRHPDDFVLDVEGLARGVLVDAARKDLAHYKDPPLTADEYIGGIRQTGLPRTADFLAGVRFF